MFAQWFDGGIEGDARPKITAMLKKMQPNAVAFNGCVVKGGAAQNKSTCITPNALRWIGTEAGVAPDPNWSTGYNKGGDPNSDMFNPGESDTTLQNGDQWFYDAKGGIRSLAELQDVYHGTVGHNSFLMMDFAPVRSIDIECMQAIVSCLCLVLAAACLIYHVCAACAKCNHADVSDA